MAYNKYYVIIDIIVVDTDIAWLAGRRISDFRGNYFWVPYFFFMGTH